MAAEREVEYIFIQVYNLFLYYDDYFKVSKNYLKNGSWVVHRKDISNQYSAGMFRISPWFY